MPIHSFRIEVGKWYNTNGGSEDRRVFITGVSPIDKGNQIYTAVNLDNEVFTYFINGVCNCTSSMKITSEYVKPRTLDFLIYICKDEETGELFPSFVKPMDTGEGIKIACMEVQWVEGK